MDGAYSVGVHQTANWNLLPRHYHFSILFSNYIVLMQKVISWTRAIHKWTLRLVQMWWLRDIRNRQSEPQLDLHQNRSPDRSCVQDQSQVQVETIKHESRQWTWLMWGDATRETFCWHTWGRLSLNPAYNLVDTWQGVSRECNGWEWDWNRMLVWWVFISA